MYESDEWSGQWWMPDRPDRAVPGVLRYDPDDGLALSLIGGFEERILRRRDAGVVEELEGVQTWVMLHGHASGKDITLLDCTPTSSRSYGIASMFREGPDEQRVSALRALVGVHLDAPQAAVFTGVEVSIENLTAWAAQSVFSGTLQMKDNQWTGEETITARPLDELTVELDGVTAALGHRHTALKFDHRRGETAGSIADRATLRLSPAKPISADTLTSHVHTVQDLMTLACHVACGIVRQEFLMPPSGDGPPVARRVKYLAQSHPVAHPQRPAVEQRNMLFTLDDVPFEEILPRWFKVKDQFTQPCNMVLGLRYLPGGYIEPQVVTAVATAESMHRALDLTPPMDQEEFAGLRSTLLDATASPEHRKYVSDRFRRNEASLKQRLLALAERPDQEAMASLLPDPGRWAALARDARNGIAHTGATPKQSIGTLYAVVHVTSAVVVLNLLHEIGLDSAAQQRVVKEHRDFRKAQRLADEHLSR